MFKKSLYIFLWLWLLASPAYAAAPALSSTLHKEMTTAVHQTGPVDKTPSTYGYE